MVYINFQDIKDEHLHGEWRRKSNVVGNSDPLNPFARAERHEFHKSGLFRLKDDEDKVGTWSVVYSDDLLKRPYVQFEMESVKVLALITRLKCNTDCNQAEMTLYLASGLELDLEKELKL